MNLEFQIYEHFLGEKENESLTTGPFLSTCKKIKINITHFSWKKLVKHM